MIAASVKKELKPKCVIEKKIKSLKLKLIKYKTCHKETAFE